MSKVRLLLRTPVVPEDRGADDLVPCIQRHKSMHLPGEADPFDLGEIDPFGQFLQAGDRLVIPVLRVLLRPPGLREVERVRAGDDADRRTALIHQQKLDS